MSDGSAALSASIANVNSRRAWLRSKVACLLLCIFCTLAAPSGFAAEYAIPAVKAAFLHRFAAYVEWPTPSANPATPFTIAVLDDDEVASHLKRLLPGLTIQNRRAQVVSISKIADAKDAQILYIGSTQSARAKALTNTLKGKPILIVTGHEKGLADGAAINFVQVGRNVRFEVSLSAARNNGLQINSGLLSVAVRVEEEPQADSDSGDWPSFTHSLDLVARLASETPPTIVPRVEFHN